jgi:hypothetical protein
MPSTAASPWAWVSRSTSASVQPVRPCEPNGLHHVDGAGAAHDQAGTAVDHRAPDRAHLVVGAQGGRHRSVNRVGRAELLAERVPYGDAAMAQAGHRHRRRQQQHLGLGAGVVRRQHQLIELQAREPGQQPAPQ